MNYICKLNLDSIVEERQEKNWKAKFWLDSQEIPYEEERGVCAHRYITAALDKKQFKELCKAINCDQPTVYF